MKSKKVTMLAAALVVAVVAAAGIGYATSPAFKATTSNGENVLQSTYIVMKQDGNGAYFDLFSAIYFDTVTSKASATAAEVTTYTPVCSYVEADGQFKAPTGTETATFALVSKPLTLEITKNNASSETATMEIEADNFTSVTGLKYTMVLVKDPGSSTAIPNTYKAACTTATSGKAVWSIPIALNSGDNSTTYAVYLFVSLANQGTSAVPANGESIETAGFGSSTTKSTFTFTATIAAA